MAGGEQAGRLATSAPPPECREGGPSPRWPLPIGAPACVAGRAAATMVSRLRRALSPVVTGVGVMQLRGGMDWCGGAGGVDEAALRSRLYAV